MCVQHHALQQLALRGARGSPAAAVHPAPGSQLLMRGRGGQDTSYVFINYLLRIMEVEYIFFSYFSHIVVEHKFALLWREAQLCLPYVCL